MPPTIVRGASLEGVEAVVAALADRLEARVPAELAKLEDAYGRPVPVLVAPDDPEFDLWRVPQLYGRTDRVILEPDDYPAVLVTPQATDEAMIIDVDGGAAVYRIPYRVRVWGFCRYYGAEEVAACRNRLGLAILQALLTSPRLAEGLSVQLSGWRQSWSDVGVDDRDESTVAGYWLEFIVLADETVTLDTVALAGDVSVVVHPEAD